MHLASFPSTSDIAGEDGLKPSPTSSPDLQKFVDRFADKADKEGNTAWNELRRVRDDVLKALEEARNNKLIGTGLEAQVLITAADPLRALLKRHEAELRYLFIVSAVQTRLAASPDGAEALKVEIKKAEGQKCERCWNYSIHVGENKNYPTICERCSAVLKEIGGE